MRKVLRIVPLLLLPAAASHAQVSNLIYSYILNPGGNQTAVEAGGTLRFNLTNVTEFTTATFIVSNRGSIAVQLNSAAVNEGAFRLSGLPLFPATIGVNNDLRFTVTFSPTSRTLFREQLRLNIAGVSVSVALEGQGAGAQFAYQAIEGSIVRDIPADGVITASDTALGTTTTVRIRLRNTGNSPARINAITVTGPANTYQLSELPPFPATIAAGTMVEFVLSFTPREPGVQPGRLRLDNILVPIEAKGVGPLLRYTAVSGGASTPVLNNGTVNFPNTAAGTRSSITIVIENAGNADAVLTSISTSGAGFLLSSPLPSPARIAPNEQASLGITFAPETTGSPSGQLQLDDQRINLRGAATTPPPIPAVTLTAADTANPLQQPSVAIKLESPYSLPLTGRLTLAFNSETFADDPAIQFSTGGRTVDFRIPENTTEAIFPDGSRQILFQAGTVAGTIGLSVTFAVAQVNMTPNPVPSRSIALAQAAPQLTGIQVANRTSTGFDLLITGYSTARTVSSMRLQFAAVPGTELQTSSLDQNVEASFNSWYQGTGSRSFGSQFLATIRIQGTGDLSMLQSVSVTATNSRGTSPVATANLR